MSDIRWWMERVRCLELALSKKAMVNSKELSNTEILKIAGITTPQKTPHQIPESKPEPVKSHPLEGAQ